MRSVLLCVLVIIAVFIAGVVAGRVYQHYTSGHFYEVQTQQTYDASFGEVELIYATDTIGLPLMDPGTTSLVLKHPSGMDLTVYKARRMFQESYPYFEELDVDGNELRWDDGLFVYTLLVEESTRDREATPPADPAQEP